MRILWFTIGAIALLAGIIGILLPIVPTVPFLLVAVWAFARSSPRLRQKILSHPKYGPPIRAWEDHRAIGRWAKIWAVVAMTVGVFIAFFIGLPIWWVATQLGICTAVGAYVVTRPEH
ncbi:YbaN family protein [Paracoccus fistulariae]|uniref:YbaN family protein n=1 Tax=Paracoccus fistulariae TaxID=658446 RepID=A0ABY7SGZ1_9RHOB|nr:YbaN family protein [Paracoccus fistulariae]MDB6180973.1 YbaN family protein [Paracoccus fistulariae]WCR06269.1 YbaN family protein [Paracoccus fistulariae]